MEDHMNRKLLTAAGLTLAIVAQGCAAKGTTAIPSTTAATAVNGTSPLDLAKLPLDDDRYTTAGPKVGWVYSCQASFDGGGAGKNGPWIDLATNTWNWHAKLADEGAVGWTSQRSTAISGASRRITGNGLPAHETGIYPIQSSDPAYQYDGNPNHIESQDVDDAVPLNPKLASKPSCTNMGPIGIMTTGAQLYNALDALGRDAAAHEVLDKCGGHPDPSGTYHYHAPSACMSDPGTGHSHLLGYALDGFGIYGVRGTNGSVLSSANLDACHGHSHAVEWNGKTVVMYHYHMTYDFPYSIGCYRGTPVATGHGGPP
jgi:YHYH protein